MAPIYANPEPRAGTYGTRSLRGSHQHRLKEDEPMLKRSLATTAGLGLCALPLAAQGHAATAGNEMTITGSVVDLNCHTTNGAAGPAHKACAQACAKAGVPLGPGELLVTERTGEGVVLDTAGRPLREWDSPDVASLYAAAGRGREREGRVVAVRSPYYVPQLASPEPDTAPLIRVLDTLGRPVAGLATIRRPAVPLLSHLVNAGAVAAAPDGSVYFAPLVRDEIRKYGRGGELRWTAQRGLAGTESDPVFLPPPRGSTELQLRSRLVNVALVLGPDGRLYALGSDDSSATRLRLDVVDTATGAIVATRHLGAREGAVALDARGALALLDAD